MKKVLITSTIGMVFIFIAAAVCSWLFTCGIVKILTLCFGLDFSWGVATGIWIIWWIFNSIFNKKK